ncbi:hypothetical protein [Chitinophaga sp. GbtcB8]|uniref:hypothetical protein n=1 Tax=Chitinophaga sp. GbtcB8 TaxID=2824753 RepID=UPI001C30236D|nr:hypothetical protein [Chitinophaga sp. GbtcB8]
MPNRYYPDRLQVPSHQSIQESNTRHGIQKTAVPVKLETNHTEIQQPVIQGVFVFDGSVVVNFPGDHPIPYWEKTHQKIYDAVYDDYVYVPIGQVKLYRKTMEKVRAQHPPTPVKPSGLEGPREDDEMREHLMALYHYHNDLPAPGPGRKRRKPTIDAFVRTYERLKKEETLEGITPENLYKQVMAENGFDDSVDDYLSQESEAEEMSLLFPEIKQVSMEEIEKLSKKTTKVGADKWDKPVTSKKGIYTDEMRPCITVGLTATSSDGQPVSALFHSMMPSHKAIYILGQLKAAFGEEYNQLSSIKYFVVGGSHESIGKAVDILNTLSQMGLSVSGVKLTTTLEERHLIKSVVVTPTGQLRYAVSVAPPTSAPISFGTDSPEQEIPSGFSSGFGRPPGGSGSFSGFGSASNINKGNTTPSFSGGFTTASTVKKQSEEGTPTQSPLPGFSLASGIRRSPGGPPPSSGFRLASQVNEQQSAPPAATGFTFASKLKKEPEDKPQ